MLLIQFIREKKKGGGRNGVKKERKKEESEKNGSPYQKSALKCTFFSEKGAELVKGKKETCHALGCIHFKPYYIICYLFVWTFFFHTHI